MPKKFEKLDLGALPVDLINRTLGTELEPGSVHMSGLAHRHAAEDHPVDYPICRQHLEATIQQPTYIGQSPKQRNNIELIRRVRGNPAGEIVLVAIGLERDDQGRYRIKSMYCVDEDTVQRRRDSGHLTSPQLRRRP